MAVKIRLSRIGKKKAPFYRIVAVDSRKKRDGANLEILGTYDGLEGVIVNLDLAKIEDWISKGAIPTDSVKKLIHAFKKGVKPGKEVKAKIKKQAESKPVEKAETSSKEPEAKVEPDTPAETKTESPEKESPEEEAAPETKE